MNPFAASRKVRFAHCDPAGIAYYPALFELCDTVIEDWTELVVGVSRREMHLDLGLALPTVDLRAEFTLPARLGETLDIALATVGVGRTSVDLAATVSCDAQPRFAVRYRQVLMDMETAAARPWPDAWRDRLRRATSEETNT